MSRIRLGGTIEEWKERVSRGEVQLHAFSGGFVFTEILQYKGPPERILHVQLLGGKNLDSWKEQAHEKLKSFARENGATAIELTCRLGLEKKIAGLGYRRSRVMMRYELDEQTILQDSRSSAAA